MVTVFRQREATEATVPIRRSRRRLGETPDEIAPEVGRTINIPSSYSTTKLQELKHELLTRNIALLSTFSMEITILAHLRSLDDQTASVDNGRILRRLLDSPYWEEVRARFYGAGIRSSGLSGYAL